MVSLKVFLLFPTDTSALVSVSEDSFILHPNNCPDFLAKLEKILDISAREKNAHCYYNEVELANFLDKFDTNEYYLTNPREELAEELYAFWERYYANILNIIPLSARYFVWKLDDIRECSNTSSIIQCAEQKLRANENLQKFVLADLGSLQFSKPHASIIKDTQMYNNLPHMVKIDIISSKLELHQWFKANRTPRNYNFGDTRHGENGVGNRPNKSPLLSTKKHVADLLGDAVGDATRDRECVYYFDDAHGAYIRYEYENENPQNLYHAYHVPEKDIQTDIPRNVIDYFDSLGD